MKACSTCRWWSYWANLVVDDDEPRPVGHCMARTIGGLTASDYSCGEHAEKEADDG